jgi:hypothetical protein
MRLFSAFLILTVAGCLPGGRCEAALPQCTLPAAALPQSTLPAAAADCPCQCPCGTTGVCTCPAGTCQCQSCPGKDALGQLKERAMKENKRLVVWTGTPGRNVPDCLACRDERFRAVSLPRPFVTVGVPSANGLVWWQFPGSVSDDVLQTVRTDGTTDAAAQATVQTTVVPPAPTYQLAYYQPSYPAAMSFQGGGGSCGPGG